MGTTLSMAIAEHLARKTNDATPCADSAGDTGHLDIVQCSRRRHNAAVYLHVDGRSSPLQCSLELAEDGQIH